jgi:protein-S-isoprenylcysteine O-methyltransferase Ste14
MNAKIGNFFFRYRNALGPVLFTVALLIGKPSYPFGSAIANITFDAAGFVVALLGQALRILTIGYEYIERGGKNKQVYASKLVQGGVFGHCRNPLYVGNILMAFGFALIVHSIAFYLIVIPFILFSYISIVAAEEAFLRDKFGQEYSDYCARVNRWVPGWAGWERSIESMHFKWNRVLVKEYNTIFLLLASLVTLKLWTEYQINGSDALPSVTQLVIGTLVWLGLYVGIRSLKKTGYVKA